MENSISKEVFDVIVIGAGVMGSSTAYQTAKRGLTTLLLEQFDFLHHRGSSHGESRGIRATYPEDYYPPMVIQSSRLWEQAQAEIGYPVYFKAKQLDIGPSANKSLLATINTCRNNSTPLRILNRHQLLEEFSGAFHIPEDWIGVVTDQGGVIKPTKAVSMLQTLAIRNGAVLKDNTQVVNILKDEETGEILVLAGEKYRCRKCVVTAGAWTRKLIEKVRGLVLPIQPLETTVHYWKIKPGQEGKFTLQSGFPTFAIYGDPYIYGTPSLEFPGHVKVAMHTGRECEPEDRTWKAAPTRAQALTDWIKRVFGELVEGDKPVMTQSCMYSMTPDEDFIIDFVGGVFGEDVVVCGGFSGHGFKMAPVVGKIAAELVGVGRVDDVDISYFRIDRFPGNGKGNVKNFKGPVRFHSKL